ncbi:aminoacyl-tRNA hydrolase [Hyphococcus sp.]|uniref:aminoacyl-tRNA hydrolase n=1 Tax=Hyphococcus sp. TaxID=2038636 RepID=UPI0035C6842A
MLLLVGLGNPGGKYARHRHNVGFMAADAIADAHGFGPARAKFQGEVRDGTIGGEKALILKPQTFMNDSGRSVGEAVRFYKIAPEDVIVFYDELDLAPGKIKMKTGGGAAGHNGIRSIDAHIGNGFRRVRIGIGHPGDKSRVTGHVLGDFAKADQDWLEPLLDAIASEAPYLAEPDNNRFQTAVAHKLAPPKKSAPAKKEPASESKPAEPNTPSKTALNVFAEVFKKRGDKE